MKTHYQTFQSVGNIKTFEESDTSDRSNISNQNLKDNKFISTFKTQNLATKKEHLKNFDLFTDLSNYLQIEKYDELVESLKIKSLQQLETVFSYGAKANHFYFIAKGQCVALIPRKEEVQIQKEDTIINQAISLHPNFVYAQTLVKGKYFGDASFRNRTIRQATVVCLTDSIFFLLHKDQYIKHLNQYFINLENDKAIFFQKVPLFQSLQLKYMTGLLIEAKKVSFRKGELLYKENQQAKNVYFLISGQIKLRKKNLIQQTQFGRQKEIKFNFLLTELCQNQLFGEVECIQNIPRIATAQVTTNSAQVYKFTYQKLMSNIIDAEIRQEIIDTSFKKLNYYRNLIQENVQNYININSQHPIIPKQIQQESKQNYLDDPIILFSKQKGFLSKKLSASEEFSIKQKNLKFLKSKGLNNSVQERMRRMIDSVNKSQAKIEQLNKYNNLTQPDLFQIEDNKQSKIQRRLKEMLNQRQKISLKKEQSLPLIIHSMKANNKNNILF